MTIEARLRTVGWREARARLRPLMDEIGAGTPIGILADPRPAGVLLHPDEAGRWERIERSLAALHGAEVYPELAADALALAALVRGERAPTAAALRRLASQRRQILSAPEYLGINDVRLSFADVLRRAGSGRPVMIASYGRPVALLIGFDEYERLTALSRAVSWFAAVGLDLAETNTDEVMAWLADYRSRAARGTGSAREASA